MMTIGKIDAAVKEAMRFISAAKAARQRIADGYRCEEKSNPVPICAPLNCSLPIGAGSAETAACRRASLDLTRALAELRK